MLWLKQSTAATLRLGPFLDDTDGKTAETTLTISQADVRLSKNGGAAAQKNDATACTHDENGYYSCPVNTTDTNTLGRLRVEVIESGALPVWHEYLVVPANVYDSLVSGSDYLQADSVQIEGADATDTINAQADLALSDYAPAQAGDAMDLVNAPNATAITAIQSGLAPANEYDVEMARIDDTVSSRAQAGDAMTLNDLGAGKVWDALLTGLITPDSIGKLIVDSLDAAISSRGTADPGDAMTLTSAYDAAKTAAQAGEAAAAIADYDPLTAADVEQAPTNFSSLGITADGRVDVGAVGGTTVTDPDDLKANVSNLDVAVSSRSSHSAADVASAVWAAGTRTLTGFGTLVADVVAGVWAAAQRTLTAFGFTAAANVTQVAGEAVTGPEDLKADVSALALEASLTSMQGATFDTSTDSLEAIRNRGDAAWITGGGSGTGSRTIVFTLSDGAGTLAGSLKTQVEDSEGNLVAGPLATDSSGVVTYYLDDGSYELVSASSPYWRGNSESVTVSASAAVAVTLTAHSLPVPSSANKYTVIIDCADEYGDLVGASAWAIKVLNVLPRGLSTANLVQLTEQNAITTDANGRASFEIAEETTSITLSITPKLADNSNGDTLTFTVEVSADDADESGIIYFADLLHR